MIAIYLVSYQPENVDNFWCNPSLLTSPNFSPLLLFSLPSTSQILFSLPLPSHLPSSSPSSALLTSYLFSLPFLLISSHLSSLLTSLLFLSLLSSYPFTFNLPLFLRLKHPFSSRLLSPLSSRLNSCLTSLYFSPAIPRGRMDWGEEIELLTRNQQRSWHVVCLVDCILGKHCLISSYSNHGDWQQ